MVTSPEEYRWSSYTQRLESLGDNWLDEHSLHENFGTTSEERWARYRDWVHASIPAQEWELIRDAGRRGQLTGSARFRERVGKKIGRRLEFRGCGRPRSRK